MDHTKVDQRETKSDMKTQSMSLTIMKLPTNLRLSWQNMAGENTSSTGLVLMGPRVVSSCESQQTFVVRK